MPVRHWIAALLLALPGVATALDEAAQRERIAYGTRQMEEMLVAEGKLLGDPTLDAYLQAVLVRLFPADHQRLRVRVIRDAEFNAFAVGSGNIYFNTGTLLRLQDEAQLSAILAHEGGHVLRDHSYRSWTNTKGGAAVGAVLGLGLGAAGITPALGQLMAVSSIMGYSRDLEREADATSMERLQAAGYDTAAGAEVFARMARELKARKTPPGAYMFASHPKLEDREQTMRELAGTSAGKGERNPTPYLQATAAVRWLALEQLHGRNEGMALIQVLEVEKLQETLPPAACFYLAEGYRLRREPGDEEKLPRLYEECAARAPDFALTHYALGRQRLKAGDRAGAAAAYSRYLELAPQGREAGFVRAALQRLQPPPSTVAPVPPPPDPAAPGPGTPGTPAPTT